MVAGERYTLYEEVGEPGFPSSITIPETTCRIVTAAGDINDAAVGHAVEAAQEADSDTCTVDRFILPNVVRITESNTALAGFNRHNAIAPDRAIKRSDSAVVMCGNIFELGLDDHENVIKVCARYPYDDHHDQIAVIDTRSNVLVTTWLNDNRDQHSSLDSSQYDTRLSLRLV